MNTPAKNTICLWYDCEAENAARFYARTFPDSSVGAVHLAPGDFPFVKRGDVLTGEFTVMGIPCLGLTGGPAFKHNESFSFQVATVAQAETDRYWNAIVGNGGQESACGWSACGRPIARSVCCRCARRRRRLTCVRATRSRASARSRKGRSERRDCV